ncbi:hypothetical protein CRUP_014189 [Coryphaenoides rupestris]|nr:hypothetical protein CRUP_014189 [Coryphaenoides rupestris]
MDDVLALKESVLFYLDRSGGLVKLIEDCELFNGPQQSEAVYRLCVVVNPSDVMEVDAGLGDRVLHDPHTATRLFRSVCFISIKTLNLIEKIHTENQVNIILKLTHLPPFPEYTLDLRASPRPSHGDTARPMAMEGLVVAVTRTTKYTQGARFLCSDEECPCSTGFHHIRVHRPGATESATLVEFIHVRVLDLLNVHPQSSLRYQSVTLFLRDELCHSMRLGHPVTGCWAYLRTCTSGPASPGAWRPTACGHPHQVSEDFRAVLRATACSPWRFPGLLAHSFGCDVVPPGRYNTLKLALPARTRHDTTFHCLDLLALATDTLLIDRLMAYSLSLAVRGVRHQLQGEMFASLSRDEHGTGTANVHAGAALLASGGVCMLGDLGGYRKDKLDAIQSALESRAVGVFVPGRRYGEEADQQLSFPLRCSFWALADSTEPLLRRGDSTLLGAAVLMAYSLSLAVRGVRHQLQGEMFASLSRDEHGTGTANVHAGAALLASGGVCMLGDLGGYRKDKLDAIHFWALADSTEPLLRRGDSTLLGAALAESFGLLVRCSDPVGGEAVLAQTAHTLRQALDPCSQTLYPHTIQFPFQDYKEFLAHARGLRVELSSGAEKMIHGYYMASRRVRADQNHGVKVSVASVKLLQAHCKLCLRTTVHEEDSLVAVLLCENAITLRHGASVLVIPPDAAFPCNLSAEEVVEALHHRRELLLENLHQDVLRFIYAYAPGAESYITEE